ncbi:MAG: hypothetical protein LBN32_03715, partial [Helicobacteraceae bacterium]|nr:hypothetical protein [Helicobacteraceae bacterium]
MNLKNPLLLALLPIGLAAASVSIDVLDATVKDKRVESATVILQQQGEKSLQTQTNASGKATIDSQKPIKTASTMLIIKKEGYSDLVVACPCDGMTYALSPVMKSLDGLRVVLTWGAKPIDLDSHLVFGDNHVYFEKKGRRNAKAYLDVDDSDSFGPETITIQKIEPQSYVYAVHNFSQAYCAHIGDYDDCDQQAPIS